MTIKYNILNLPELIQFKNGNQIKNSYAADGRKLKTEYYTLSMPLTVPIVSGQVFDIETYAGTVNYSGTSFLDNFEYKLSKNQAGINYDLVRVYNSEGYVLYFSRDENYYGYFCKDHLGSIREVWLAYGEGFVIQRTQYYPSGLPWADSFGGMEQPLRYNGKEFVEAHGLDEYDYGARGMYPAIMRFTTMDPLAEDFYETSPYAYVLNNPINYIDPTGMYAEKADEKEDDEKIQEKILKEIVVTAKPTLKQGTQVLSEEPWLWNVWYAVAGFRQYEDASGYDGFQIRKTYNVGASGKIISENNPFMLTGTPDLIGGKVGMKGGASIVKGIVNTGTKGPITLQTGGNVLNKTTLKALKLTKEQGKFAIEGLKKDLGLRADFHGKILSNGDVVHPHTKQVIGNLFDYLP